MSKTRAAFNQLANKAGWPIIQQSLRAAFAAEHAVKPATTARASNATISADPDLVVTLLAGVPYLIEVTLPITTGATPGFQFDFTGGTLGTTQTDYFVGVATLYTANQAAVAAVDIAAVNTAVSPTAANHTRGYATVTAKFNTSGTLALAWAQKASNGVTAAQLLAGARLTATPLDLVTGR
jgi:hypothetical protein